MNGGVVACAITGKMGFKGSRKSTPFAAQQAADRCARECKEMGMRKVEAWVKGPGAGREAAIRSLKAAGLEVSGVKDVTPAPHNGCRQKKRRRV
jgi:small subunit ribosomal protein S11